ncbi:MULTISPECIES: peptidoglycan editing factor PgeF [unclassified Arcicella]|uniref:peptidoglycan editing factor PgeF n=1 Tax=unclassified Arcicella TaxID=2644986 RepID=UPI002856D615|nr:MULTISPECIES: peptidoglycan editing factor PgeF [unclassified Arcicella]MDR6559988.1 YfiH family protein [Arcicella sp. BE51]MDR6810405.1 YfiH family protein [Arcicella sp. BE140]MDR6821755.1 YfiH family protein [Arcicella sp. BE139]
MFTRPQIFEQFTALVAAESTRKNGFSEAPYNSLNLGLYSGDSLENVHKNRDKFYEALGFSAEKVAFSYQIHEDKVLTVTKAGSYDGFDALITNQADVYIAVTIADCTPILIYDATQKAVAAIHAGWRGTVLGIVGKTITQMTTAFGTNPKDCFAYVGTCIDECSFEVGEEVAQNFDSQFKRFDAEKAKYFVDLKKANQAQLLALGVPTNHIEISKFSTVLDNENYFSHRKEKGKTGRMLAIIGVKNG